MLTLYVVYEYLIIFFFIHIHGLQISLQVCNKSSGSSPLSVQTWAHLFGGAGKRANMYCTLRTQKTVRVGLIMSTLQMRNTEPQIQLTVNERTE